MAASVETIQLALFLRASIQLDASQLWHSITKHALTGFQTIGPGQTQAQGDLGSVSAILAMSPGRVDLIVQALSAEQVNQPHKIDSVDNAVDEALGLAEQIIRQTEIGRTACVVQAYIMCGSDELAAVKVQEMVPGMPLPAHAKDATYQVSVQRQSALEARRTLKLMFKWQTVRMQLLNFTLGGIPPQQPSQVASSTFAAHMTVDAFAENIEALDAERAYGSLQEVAGLALAVIKGGYNELH